MAVLHPPSCRVHIAPMQCFTNRWLRLLLRLFSSNVVLWTEMEKAVDVVARPQLLVHDELESPLVLQLGGDDSAMLAQAATAAQHCETNFCELNLNVGCPSISTGGAAYGAALMRRPQHTRELMEALRDVAPDVPLSVKCRLGVHDGLRPDGSVPPDSLESLLSFVDTVTEGGAVSHLVVHARAAVLGGLSPSKNRCVPPLRYDYVRECAAAFPQLRVTLNGGLTLDGDWRKTAGWLGPDVDGVMIGRHALRRPLDVWHLEPPTSPPTGEVATSAGPARQSDATAGRRRRGASSRAHAIEKYARIACQHLGARKGSTGSSSAAELLAPLLLVAEQLHEEQLGDPVLLPAVRLSDDESEDVFCALWEATAAILADSRRGNSRLASLPPASQVLLDGGLDGMLPTRKLLKQLGAAVGKKEANKLSRNRAEALAR